jgi:hypothetical protein
MAGSTFQTNPYDLNTSCLEDCSLRRFATAGFPAQLGMGRGTHQKSDCIRISRAFPVGALMTLDTGGEVNFKPRPVEGAPAEAKNMSPHSLLLDGQQRMTSLYQVTLRRQVVETVTPKNKKVKRWFYIDIRKALDPALTARRPSGVPEERIRRTDFGREVVLDLSTPERRIRGADVPGDPGVRLGSLAGRL